MLAKYPIVRVAPVLTSSRRGEGVTDEGHNDTQVGTFPDELTDWEAAVADDPEYQEVRKAVEEGRQSMPEYLRLKVSIGECSVTGEGHLRFRGRRWVPAGKDLRTRIIQTVHDSTVAGHPGREGTYAFIARQFYWPGIAKDVRLFTDSYNSYRANK